MADTGEIDLRRFFRTLWRGKWILLATMVTAMGATTYWLLHVTPLYTADALIVIESHPSSIVKVDEVVQDVSSDDAKVNTEVAILESRTIQNFSRRILKPRRSHRATGTRQISAQRVRRWAAPLLMGARAL
jgi:uncharacterized protein involved in exopolysaccharide biosynthesis